jgi:hypothetical protein
MNYICLGQECSPATAMRNIGIRKYALPFDWIRSNAQLLSKVIINNFEGFHNSLKLSDDKKYITDSYGLEYPHDYPTVKQGISDINDSDEAGGINEDHIVNNWKEYIPEIQEKYKRRIERFNTIMNSSEPVIALYSGILEGVYLFKDAFIKTYNKTNIYYVVLTEEIISDEEKRLLLEEGISICDPEEVLIDENDNMFIDKEAQAKLWYDAIIHLKI